MSYLDKECYCPYCKSLLNIQNGFSFRNLKHECTECGRTAPVKIGRFASENDEYDVEDAVSEPQNVQSANNADTVEEFTENDIKIEDSDVEMIMPDDDIDGDEKAGAVDVQTEPVSNDEELSEFDEEARRLEEFNERTERRFRAWKKQNKALIWKVRGITAGVVIVIFAAVMISRLTKVGYDSIDLLEQNYVNVVHQLEANGFTDIETVPSEDLEISEKGRENTVKSIKFGSKEDFDADDHFMKGKNIKIVYRTLKKINLPISSKKIDDMNFTEVMEKFEKAGFINVSVEPVHDLHFGVLHFDGEVDEVYVDGEKKFSDKDRYRPDVGIVIKYHTF